MSLPHHLTFSYQTYGTDITVLNPVIFSEAEGGHLNVVIAL